MNEIVIKIDDVDFEYIKKGCIIPIKIDNHIYDAIRNGKVLPNGHGRLIDADDLLAEINQFDYYENVEEAPTIIEADKGEV